MSNKPTHCVIMVSYNHEKYIRIALESIFDNEVLPDKVILFDDCSADNTWNIVCEFKEKYEDILECHRNEKNLGLFQNFNQAYQAGIDSGCDIITLLAGDDYLKNGLFVELNKVVEQNKIDVKNEKFIIITNTEELYLDGTVKLIDNYRLRNEKDLIYYRLMGRLSYREVGLSRNVLKDIELHRSDLGLCEDLLVCLNYETNCEKFYFTPFVSAGYRVGVGNASKERQDVMKISRYNVEKIILEKYKLSKRCRTWLYRRVKEYSYDQERKAYDCGLRKTFPLVLFIQSFGWRAFFKRVIKAFLRKWCLYENSPC